MLLSYFFVLHLHTIQTLFTWIVLCKDLLNLRSLCFLNRIRNYSTKSLCSDSLTQRSSTHRSPYTQESVHPLEAQNKFETWYSLLQSNSDATPFILRLAVTQTPAVQTLVPLPYPNTAQTSSLPTEGLSSTIKPQSLMQPKPRCSQTFLIPLSTPTPQWGMLSTSQPVPPSLTSTC